MPDPGAHPFEPYSDLTVPSFICDGDYRLVYLNPAAEAFWGMTTAGVVGQPASSALRIAPPDERALSHWGRDVVLPALTTRDLFSCRTTDASGHGRLVQVIATRFFQAGQWYTAVTMAGEPAPAPEPAIAEWALRDPLTGLLNRHEWDRQFAARDSRPGAVVFFDLDGLKDINDLGGHPRGDEALLCTARALIEHAPAEALVVRYGGDEFLVVLTDGSAAEAFAARVVASAATNAGDSLPIPLRLSFGVAAFAPGGLRGAVDRADEGVYQRKGVVLRGAGGGRIVLTAAGRRRVLEPAHADAPAPGAFAAGFGREFDGYFRQIYGRAVQQAREFVDLVAPERGSAVVEVGAGSGRLAFDGGLAERVGEQGQLLLTDASGAQLQVARQRAERMGLRWIRFLEAPVEDLPLASATVDLVLGAVFLHFTDAPAAIRSMARVARPGGKVALFAAVRSDWGPVWQEALEPIRAALDRYGLAFRDIFVPEDQLEALFAASGLVIESKVAGTDRLGFPSAELAIAALRQGRVVSLLLRGVPPQEHPPVQADFEARFAAAIARLGLDAAASAIPTLALVARRRN